MPRKKKGELHSGSVRIQKKVGVREDGTRIMKSFTGVDKNDAERKYKLWLLGSKDEPKKGTITVSEAVRRYTESKAHVLSPATVRLYESIRRTHLDDSDLGGIYVEHITNTDLQVWISDLAAERTPKTVSNCVTLVKSALEMFNPDFRPRVTMPQKIPPKLYCPSDEDVRRLLAAVKDSDAEMYRAILLAAFGPLRRSEICALTKADIRGTSVTVSKAMVADSSGSWVVKGTKTVGSNRTVELPEAAVAALKACDGRIVESSPDVLSNRFKRLVARLGLPHIRFHDLRHYGASIMHAIGVPDQYIMQRGGWSSDNVMKRVYRNVIDVEAARQNRRITEHFSRVSHV